VKIYAVGGSVRDELLGLAVADRDYVVVGASPEELLRIGFKPVGKDFPVFLHPQTHEEYALARTERKVGPGYKGFSVYAAPDVTLEQDLERRDLTINALARDEEGRLIDPFGGERDLAQGILRHVSSAFAEDPVRILRVARFAARFGFSVAPETLRLMREMVANGEADALVPERVWQEFSKGLMEREAGRMFALLAECGLFAKLAPEIDLAYEGARPANDAARILEHGLRFAAAREEALPERFALFASTAPGASAAQDIAERMKTPTECRELAPLWHRHGGLASRANLAPASALLTLLEGCDAFRRPERLESLLRVCECREVGERGWVEQPYPARAALRCALRAAAAVDAARIAADSARGEISKRLRVARVAAIEAAHAAAVRA
jgi:tRNA nucleotidyltransferase (CCA-adding enzyme)